MDPGPRLPSLLPDLLRRHVLVVEDEYLLADELCRELIEHGAEVVGPAASIDEALACIATTPELEAAILDINLQGEMSYPIANELRQRGVPFVFVTGYYPANVASSYRDVPVFEKPAILNTVIDALMA